jgi:lysophospholipase L1-like esterase
MRPFFARLSAFAAGALVAAGFFLGVPARAQDPDSSAVEIALPHVGKLIAAGLPLRIVAFGSSSTQGIGASSPSAAYPSRLLVELKHALPSGERILVENDGVGGQDADDMILRLPKVIAEHPDLVIFQTGSNDPLRNVPLDRFIDETKAGIRMIRAASIDVMLMEPQLCTRLHDTAGASRYRDAMRSIGAEMGVPVIKRYDLMKGWLSEGVVTQAQLLSPDGLHMADGGYALLARAVAKAILGDAGAKPRLVMSAGAQ